MSIRDIVPSLWHKPNKSNNKPFFPLETLREEMDHLWDSFYPGTGLSAQNRLRNLSFTNLVPADICETENAIEVTLDLPGFDEKNIDITFADGELSIQGNQDDKREEDGKNYHRIERSYGSFRRSFYLPSEIEEDGMEAQYKKGVLTITLPKSQEAQKSQKKIEIKAA